MYPYHYYGSNPDGSSNNNRTNYVPLPSSNYFPYFYRPFPTVNPSMFMLSAHKMQSFIQDANILVNLLTNSKDYSLHIMKAAQESNQQKVEELIASSGVKQKPNVYYNPDGITLTFEAIADQKIYCDLTLKLRWR